MITKDEAWELARPLGGGGFKFGDAQGDVTHKFALAVIEWHEARKAANERRECSDDEPSESYCIQVAD
jgi:hypothetical protein